MIPLSANGKDFNLPISWSEVTAKQYRGLLGADHLAQQLEALTGMPAADWENLREVDFEERIAPVIDFLNEGLDLSGLPVPDEIEIRKGERVKVPKDITLKAWGQKLSLQAELGKVLGQNTALRYLDAVIFATAIYLCPEPYSDSRARDLAANEISALPITTVFPIGDFFFRSWIRLQSAKLASSLSALSPNKAKPESKRSAKRSKSLQPLTGSPEAIP